MGTQKSNVAGPQDLNKLLGKLRRAGQNPPQSLLDRVKAHGQQAVRPLIEMAVDEKLYYAEQDSPEVWAPLHAIRMLGELGAAEAVEPLLPLFEWDDDWLATALPDAFGGIGEPAVAPLCSLLFDRTKDVWARGRAADALSAIGQRHPETRTEVVHALTARLDPAESQTPDDEILNGFVIIGLRDLGAVEAGLAVLRAFEEDRVDTMTIRLEDVREKLGLPHQPKSDRETEPQGMRLRLRCTACHYEREHDVGTVYCDIPTMEQCQKGEQTPYSEYVITRRIKCPKCGAVDQYEFTSYAYIALLTEGLRLRVSEDQAAEGAPAEELQNRLVFGRFVLSDGREMHPLVARDMYFAQVTAEPEHADLRVRCANVLSFLGYWAEAAEQYRAAVRLDPANIEAYYNLANLTWETGDEKEARRLLGHVITLAQGSDLPDETRERYVQAAREALSGRRIPVTSEHLVVPSAPAPLAREERATPGGREGMAAKPQQPVRVAGKVGRNDPCPCGSGKKYKKCHGR
ncbi:MAG: DUF1186 domain-containing protein [Chloroflexota bacterium]|nr:MAG: DUF1186 domain-containing protein [Chloroflexota bacterium]